MKTKNYVNFGSPPIHLAPLRRVDREADRIAQRLYGARRSRKVREWIDEEFGPDVAGRDGEPCPNCSRTRILFIPTFNGSHSMEWWRCCGLRVNGDESSSY